MSSRLSGKVAVITGSTSGIGEGIARVMAAEGASVVISGRRSERGESVAASIVESGGSAVFQQADLESSDDCLALIARATEAFGGLDILVNNAGIFWRKPFMELTARDWDSMFNTNLRAAFLCSHAAIEPMTARGGGSIINIGSCHAFGSPMTMMFAYSCSKGALYMMSKKMASELASRRIRVNWITAGWIMTEQEIAVEREFGFDDEKFESIRQRQPMKRFTEVQDIADGCVYLAADESKYITGADLNISSGICVHV